MKKTTIIVLSIAYISPSHVFAEYGGSGSKAEEYQSESVPPNQLGQMWRPDKGMMFMSGASDSNLYLPSGKFEEDDNNSGAKIDNRRSLTKSGTLDQFCMTLRLQQNFDYKDVQDGPATFSWSHPAGGSDSWDADASLRADFWIPGLYDPKGAEMSIALGYDIRRSETPTSKIDTQRFHLAVPFVPYVVTQHIPFLNDADQVFQMDLSYGMDRISNDNGFDFETNYTPVFKLAKFGPWIGVPCGFDDGKALTSSSIIQKPYYSFVPKVGLSYGEKYTLGSPTANLNNEVVFSYEARIKLGTQFGITGINQDNRRINAELSYALKGGDSFGNGGGFTSQEIRLELKPTLDSTASLIIAYENGAKSFSEKDSELTSISLGWGF